MNHANPIDLPILITSALLLLGLLASKIGGRLGVPWAFALSCHRHAGGE